MKRCPQCTETKPLGAFTRQRSSPDGRHGWCRECRNTNRRTPAARDQRNTHRRQRRRRDPDFRAQENERKRTPEAKERANTRRRERRATDPEYRERENARRRTPRGRAKSNALKRTSKHRARRNENRRSRYSQDTAYRRSEKAKARLPRLKIAVKLAARDGWVCGRRNGVKGCGNLIDKAGAEIDHIVPASKGGSDDLSNLQLLCRSCNRAWAAREEVSSGPA